MFKNISKEKLNELKEQGIDWAFGNGFTMIKRPTEEEVKKDIVTITHVPFSLYPSAMNKKLFEEAVNLSQDYNILVHNVSKDFDFLQNTLKDVQDDFTQKLLEIHRQVNKEGIKQKKSLGVFRSDYMLHDSDKTQEPRIYQVELNTISSSLAVLSTKIFELHKHLIGRNDLNKEGYNLENHPDNKSSYEIVEGLATAHQLYNKADSVVMMIIQDGEKNIFDQKGLEWILWDKYKIKLIRRTLKEINERAVVNNSDFTLSIDGYEISVSYYRSGYTPNDYPSEVEWSGRLLVERSSSIKCPTIAHHLVGVKKIQQVLAKPGVLEKFITNKESFDRLKRSFTGLYSLSKEDIDQEVVKKAIANPNLYVMKPQREGGGNNIYNEDVAKELQSMTPDQLSSYILMDKIVSTSFKTHVVRDRQLLEIDALYELGIYSVFISDESDNSKDQVVVNKNAGILLRTKTSHSNEVGVAAGFGLLDSPILY
ncbi:hypothetical protein DICPUDRAFT_153877 [Dictyostelium purpureum]|uniref:Glutathione synthetase n=1 Tax=Dictyostelium purpureum TaxID=5786 RepID=F0ZPZ0_DICPU|nr:uncharacterized protein DICPUDRAFT_153877 [Dictyostelium purpureum]EGC34001.1 hypothetical protein DICPUDRAFT_153877 [Dictyostelium purpureum]|eukprot:XP_003289487.1 hypothetical protein DICPUDRAFT_153877 [Dictyostelium purpureum]